MKFIHYLLPFLTPLLLYSSFHPVNIPVLAWLALVPLLIFAMREKKNWRACWVSYLAGYLYWTISIWWVGYVAPIGPFLLSLYFAIYFAIFVLLLRIAVINFNAPLTIATPAIWVVLEFVRCYLLTGFPWFYLGHTQYEFLWLIQISDITGVYGVSFIVVLANGLITHIILLSSEKVDLKNNLQFKVGGIAFAVLILSVAAYGIVRTKNLSVMRGPDIALIQANIPQEVKHSPNAWQMYDKHIELSRNVGETDLIVWPETMFPYAIPDELKGSLAVNLANRTAIDLGKKMLVGVETYSNNESFNSAIFIDPIEGIEAKYSKVHIVPFGEFIPLKSALEKIIKIYTKLDFLPDLSAGKEFNLFQLDGHRFGVIICFESIFPDIVRELKNKGGAFVINISNDGWFRDSAELDQSLIITAFRAIENRIGIIRATNTGISAFISPSGEIESILTDRDGNFKNVEGILQKKVSISNNRSFYSKYGDVFVYLNMIALAGFIIRKFVGLKSVLSMAGEFMLNLPFCLTKALFYITLTLTARCKFMKRLRIVAEIGIVYLRNFVLKY